MRITALDIFVVDGGASTFHFLKVSTDEGLAGWSEFGDGAPALGGLAPLIRRMGERVIGQDPRGTRRLSADLYAATRMAAGGMNAQAIAAIENACLDLHARSLGVSVNQLFGGALRTRLPVYWSHCGMLRVRAPEMVGAPSLRSLDDVAALGAEVARRGFRALKTNLFSFDGEGGVAMHRAGFAAGGAGPTLNATPQLIAAARDLIDAFRAGAGPQMEIALDLNFHFRADGMLRMARALEDRDMAWLEMDVLDPDVLASIRQATSTPIGSLEAIYDKRGMAPFMRARAVDMAIIDVMWNGWGESLAMAALAEAHEVSCAPHVYAGPLSVAMSAQFASLLPNLRIMEFDVDAAPWVQDFVSAPLSVEAGEIILPSGPGWGVDINEVELHRRAVA